MGSQRYRNKAVRVTTTSWLWNCWDHPLRNCSRSVRVSSVLKQSSCWLTKCSCAWNILTHIISFTGTSSLIISSLDCQRIRILYKYLTLDWLNVRETLRLNNISRKKKIRISQGLRGMHLSIHIWELNNLGEMTSKDWGRF